MILKSIILGGTSSLNQSYIVQASGTNTPQGQMTYTICPCSTDVCRIKFDFTQFMLAGPVVFPAGTGKGSDAGKRIHLLI